MRQTRWALCGAAVLAAAAGGVVATSDAGRPTAEARAPVADTAAVQRGALSAVVSQAGVLTYRAASDGTPYPVIGRAAGTYTRLPRTGDEVRCGGVLHRVDDEPVLLLCGALPLYRTLREGMRGRDVRQLNRQLHRLGCDAGARIRVDQDFTARTRRALEELQRRRGMAATGVLEADAAVVLPGAARVAEVTAQLGAPARPGTPVLTATSDVLHVQVDLDPFQQGEVEVGDRVQVTLPDGSPVGGRVAEFGRVAEASADQGGQATGATVPTSIDLDDPRTAGGLDRAPVQVDITTEGVDDALSVPVTALLGRAGGGYAVEVVRPGGRRELVSVALGLFDTGGGRVQVEGELAERELVVVPAA